LVGRIREHRARRAIPLEKNDPPSPSPFRSTPARMLNGDPEAAVRMPDTEIAAGAT
jgi:hypothetical protein